MQIETFNHGKSTDDAQEKQARSYELAFTENSKFVNSKSRAHFFLIQIFGYMKINNLKYGILTNYEKVLFLET